jgi:putative addiction module killer protein
MIELVQTVEFETWMEKLRDVRGRARIIRRLDRLTEGNPGDVRPSARGCRNCGSMWARATGSTSCRTGTR